jgi:hypothetical protein
MTINLTLNPKLRNVIAETVAILGIANATLPQLAADSHIPAWVGIVVALLINIGNQLIKDSTIPPGLVTSSELDSKGVFQKYAIVKSSIPVTIPK